MGKPKAPEGFQSRERWLGPGTVGEVRVGACGAHDCVYGAVDAVGGDDAVCGDFLDRRLDER